MLDEEQEDAPRISRVWVSNYRSLTDEVDVSFGALTALVGLNGAGKSSVLDALRFVRDALTEGLETAVSRRLGIARLRRAPSRDKPRNLSVDVQVTQGSAHSVYGFALAAVAGEGYRVSRETLSRWEGDVETPVLDVRNGVIRIVPPGLAPAVSQRDLALPSIAAHSSVRSVVQSLRQVRVHAIYPRALASPQPVGKTPPLDDDGTNWAEVLLAMHPDRRAQLVADMRSVLPDLADIDIATANGFRSVEFVHQQPSGRRRSFNAAQESDGTLRIAGILTALLQDDRPSFLGIEEPELTINPGLLPLLVDALRDASRRTTVVVTSHSPDLLDLVEGHEVRVAERTDGESTVTALADGQLDVVRRGLMGPGELLRSGGLQGEGSATGDAEDVSDVVMIGPPG